MVLFKISVDDNTSFYATVLKNMEPIQMEIIKNDTDEKIIKLVIDKIKKLYNGKDKMNVEMKEYIDSLKLHIHDVNINNCDDNEIVYICSHC